MTRFENPLAARCFRQAEGSRTIPYGIPFLDDAKRGIAPSDLVLLGAYTGVGKTQIAMQIARNAAKQGKNVHFFALEARKNEIENRMIWGELTKEWFRRHPNGIPGVVLTYRDWLLGYLETELGDLELDIIERLRVDTCTLKTIYPENYTVERFIADFDSIKEETDLVILDHMHYFDFSDENEMKGIKAATKKIRQAALENNKAVLLLAHLRKTSGGKNDKSPIPDIDDFYGSSDLTKIATDVIIAARAAVEEEDSSQRGTWLYLAKAREAGHAQGYAGMMMYDMKTGTYRNSYSMTRVKRFCEPELLEKEKIPRWAKHAFAENDTPESYRARREGREF